MFFGYYGVIFIEWCGGDRNRKLKRWRFLAIAKEFYRMEVFF